LQFEHYFELYDCERRRLDVASFYVLFNLPFLKYCFFFDVCICIPSNIFNSKAFDLKLRWQ